MPQVPITITSRHKEKYTKQTKKKNIDSPYICNTQKYCSQMASCEEAYFQLNQCGAYKRDADNDGIPCETICL